MKALPLIRTFSEQYTNHIVLIGQFHTSMNYLNMLGHKLAGSGYSEILIEADLVTSGCLCGVLNGKAYSKSLFCLKTVCEAMERLLLERFMEEEKDLTITDPVALLILVQSCDLEKLDTAIKDPMTLNVIEKYIKYENKVRTGHLYLYLYLFDFRYLTWFDMLLRNIELTHPGAEELLRKGAIAVAC